MLTAVIGAMMVDPRASPGYGRMSMNSTLSWATVVLLKKASCHPMTVPTSSRILSRIFDCPRTAGTVTVTVSVLVLDVTGAPTASVAVTTFVARIVVPVVANGATSNVACKFPIRLAVVLIGTDVSVSTISMTHPLTSSEVQATPSGPTFGVAVTV